jgi:hypothetical protein
MFAGIVTPASNHTVESYDNDWCAVLIFDKFAGRD